MADNTDKTKAVQARTSNASLSDRRQSIDVNSELCIHSFCSVFSIISSGRPCVVLAEAVTQCWLRCLSDNDDSFCLSDTVSSVN